MREKFSAKFLMRWWARAARVRGGVTIVVCLICICVTRAGAQAENLSELKVTGSKLLQPAQIVMAAGLKVGQKVDQTELQAAANLLERTGVFESVSFRYAEDAKGLAVEFKVVDAQRVPILFDNFPWFTDEELLTELRTSVPLFTPDLPKQGGILDDVASALTVLLPKRGAKGDVSHELVNVPGTENPVQRFRVDGSALKVEALEFKDALAREDHSIQQASKELVGQDYSRFAVEDFESEQVRPVYLSDGRLGVKFGLPMARFTGDPNKPLKNTVAVIVPIEAGPKYVWDGATWEGNTVVPTQQLDGVLTMKRGAPANGVTIEAAWLAARDAYLKLGYLDVQVHPDQHLDPATKRASYKVSIVEGPQYKMGKLVLTGLSPQDQKIIVDAWKIKLGEPIDETYLSQFVDEGAREALSGVPAHYDKISYYLEKHAQAGAADVMIDFQ